MNENPAPAPASNPTSRKTKVQIPIVTGKNEENQPIVEDFVFSFSRIDANAATAVGSRIAAGHINGGDILPITRNWLLKTIEPAQKTRLVELFDDTDNHTLESDLFTQLILFFQRNKVIVGGAKLVS